MGGFILCGRTYSLCEDLFTLGGVIHCGRIYSLWEDLFNVGGFIHFGRIYSLWEDLFTMGGFYSLWEGPVSPLVRILETSYMLVETGKN